MRPRRMLAGVMAFLLAWPCGPVAAGIATQPSPPSAEAASDAQDPLHTGVSLERIRRGLETPRPKRLTLPDMPIITVQVEGRMPALESFFGTGRWTYGPALPTPMAHREFLDAVTPRELQPYGSFSSGELAQIVATSLIGALVRRAVSKAVADAARARREEEARREVRETLEALERAKAAGPQPEHPDRQP